MNIKILTPEIVVFEGEVDSVLLPGEIGEFHILNNHAAVVSALKMGKIKLITRSIENENQAKFFTSEPKDQCFSFKINGGVVEFRDNAGIILCD